MAIKIKAKNKGKFTASAKKAGQSVQQHAKSVLNDPNATPLQKKRANFARNSTKFKHETGGNNWTNLSPTDQNAGIGSQFTPPQNLQQYNVQMPDYQTVQNSNITPNAPEIRPTGSGSGGNSFTGSGGGAPSVGQMAGWTAGIANGASVLWQGKDTSNIATRQDSGMAPKAFGAIKEMGKSIPMIGGFVQAGDTFGKGFEVGINKANEKKGPNREVGASFAAFGQGLFDPIAEHQKVWQLQKNKKISTGEAVGWTLLNFAGGAGIGNAVLEKKNKKDLHPDLYPEAPEPTQNPFNQQEGNLLENLNNNPVMANYGGSLRSMSKYNHGGDLEHYNLPLHKNIDPTFANAHLDNKGVQINAKETIHRKENGGDYVFSDSLKKDGKTFAELSKKIETKTKKPYFDPASIAVKKHELGKLEVENDIAREKVESKQNGGMKKYVEGGSQYISPKVPKKGSNDLTTGDYIQLAGSAVAPLANIAMSMRKPEKVKAHLDTTQYADNQIAKDYNPIFLAENSATRDIDQGSLSDSVRRAARTSLASNTQNAISDYALKVDNANKLIKMQQEQARAGTNRFNAGVLTNRDVMQSQTNAVKQSYLNTGISQLGQSAVNFGNFKNEGLLNQMKLSTLNEIAANYKIDPDTLQKMYKDGKIQINWKTGKIKQ